MVNKVYLDASFFVALQIPQHPFFPEAKAILSLIAESTIYLSPLTIDEILYALSKYGLPRETIRAVLVEKLFKIQKVQLIRGIRNKSGLEKYVIQWEHTGLKPRDAMHLYHMKQDGVDYLLSFDSKHFKKRQIEFGIQVLETVTDLEN